MSLEAWIEAQGYGAIQRLHEASRVSLPAIMRAREGRASLATAIKLSAATDGAVRIATMTADEVPPELERRRKRVA